jgi:hypothetical protein
MAAGAAFLAPTVFADVLLGDFLLGIGLLPDRRFMAGTG